MRENLPWQNFEIFDLFLKYLYTVIGLLYVDYRTVRKKFVFVHHFGRKTVDKNHMTITKLLDGLLKLKRIVWLLNANISLKLLLSMTTHWVGKAFRWKQFSVIEISKNRIHYQKTCKIQSFHNSQNELQFHHFRGKAFRFMNITLIQNLKVLSTWASR